MDKKTLELIEELIEKMHKEIQDGFKKINIKIDSLENRQNLIYEEVASTR